jgi:hypothetical protein
MLLLLLLLLLHWDASRNGDTNHRGGCALGSLWALHNAPVVQIS